MRSACTLATRASLRFDLATLSLCLLVDDAAEAVFDGRLLFLAAASTGAHRTIARMIPTCIPTQPPDSREVRTARPIAAPSPPTSSGWRCVIFFQQQLAAALRGVYSNAFHSAQPLRHLFATLLKQPAPRDASLPLRQIECHFTSSSEDVTDAGINVDSPLRALYLVLRMKRFPPGSRDAAASESVAAGNRPYGCGTANGSWSRL